MNKQHCSNKVTKAQSSTSIKSKLGSFQSSLRKKQINAMIHEMREELLLANNEDYHLLKNIDLNQCLNQIDQIDDIKNELRKIDQVILNMYAYCVAQNSSHMYSMMSDFTLQKLIKMVAWKNIADYEMKPRVYVRIHMIIANYCNYAENVPSVYFDVMGQILQHILKETNFYEQSVNFLYFTYPQTKELINVIFYGLSQINFSELANFDQFIQISRSLMHTVLNETTKLIHSFQKNEYDQNNKATTILSSCLRIFQNFLALDITQLDGKNDSKSTQIQNLKIIESLDITIINKLLEVLKYLNNTHKQHQILIVDCLISYFRTNLQQRPEILLNHDFSIILDCFKRAIVNVMQTHSQIFNFDKRLQIEGEKTISLSHLQRLVKDYEKVLSKWLRIFVLVFGVNLPDPDDSQQTSHLYKVVKKTQIVQKVKLEQAYYEIWIDWLENHIIPGFSQILKIHQLKTNEIMPKIMNILQNICLDQTLCEILLEQPVLQNFIFYNCKSEQVKIDLKRRSLLCLVNMLKASYSDELKKKMLSEAKKHDFPTIFADNVGAYSQPETNERLLEGLSILLQWDPCQKKSENNFWRFFCEAGGKYQLQKILTFEGKKWQNIVKFTQGILYQYDIHEV